MPKIPVNLDNIPTEIEPIDEGIPYNVTVRDCQLSDHEDSRGYPFIKMKLEVMEPEEWKGKTILCNYLPIPPDPGPGASRGDRRRFEEDSNPFKCFMQGFKVPVDDEGFDPRDAVGCEGQVTAQNDKFGGRNMARVQNFLI